MSTPAALSAPGWLEVEAGVQHDRGGDGARRDSVPVTLKLAFPPDWGIRVGSDAWVRSRDVWKRLVLDAGAARSLRSGSPEWSAFTGFNWLAGRLF